MARIANGAARNNRRAVPSAQEMLNSLGKQVFGDEFQGGPVASSKGEFNKATDIMYDSSQSMDYYNPTKYGNLAGLPMSMDTLYDASTNTSSRPFYEVVGLTGDFRVPGQKADPMEDTSPADITLIPTSSSNPKRPRTVAAGYDEEEEKLTVVFRDGTFYNYYEVDKNEWAAFKANRSKGAVIYQMLDFKPRGYADVSTLSKKAQQAFYRYSRGSQIHMEGKAKGQTKNTYKVNAERTVKQTGKNPSKGGKNTRGK